MGVSYILIENLVRTLHHRRLLEKGGAGRSGAGPVATALGAAAVIHHHVLDDVKFDLMVVVIVEHLHRRQLPRAAAGTMLGGAVHLLDEGGVGVLLGVQEGTLAVAEVCLVHLGRHDEVPAHVHEIDGQSVAAAPRVVPVDALGARTVPPVPPVGVLRVDLKKGYLSGVEGD